jgi:hypothetical protein
MKKICVLALAAIGALLLVEAPSWGKLDVASCARNSRQPATRCHIVRHNNPYGMTVGGNIYERVNSAIYSPGFGHSRFYYGTDPDPRIVFELHRDPSWARTGAAGRA